MTAGTIFVLCLGAGFLMFILYLARLSRRATMEEAEEAEAKRLEDKSRFKRVS